MGHPVEIPDEIVYKLKELTTRNKGVGGGREVHLPQIELPAVSQSADRVPYDSIKRLQRGGRPFKIHDLSEICALHCQWQA